MHQALPNDQPPRAHLRRPKMSVYLSINSENCGYNKTFLTTKLRELVENTTWGEEERSPFQ
jgi:hypothetical protein